MNCWLVGKNDVYFHVNERVSHCTMINHHHVNIWERILSLQIIRLCTAGSVERKFFL